MFYTSTVPRLLEQPPIRQKLRKILYIKELFRGCCGDLSLNADEKTLLMKIRRLVEIIILISHPWPHKLQLQQQQLQQQPAQIKSKRKKGEKEGKAHEIK